MNNHNTNAKNRSIIDSLVDDILLASDNEVNEIFDENHTPADLNKIKQSLQTAIARNRKREFEKLKQPVAVDNIARIHRAVSSFDSSKIESLLHIFFSNPSNSNIGLAFRNEDTQSDHDRATLLEDLILQGLIEIDNPTN